MAGSQTARRASALDMGNRRGSAITSARGVHARARVVSADQMSELRRVFDETQVAEFARAGVEATRDVELDAGPLAGFPHSMEPYLRKLGLPSRLEAGVVTLLAAHTVCTEGEALTSDQAKLLQLLGIKMAVFKLSLKCRWAEGEFESYE